MAEDTADARKDYKQAQRESRKFRHFLIKVGLVYILLSIALFYLFSSLMKNHAYYDMSKDEINHISEMVFEDIFSVMLSGKGKAEIDAATHRLTSTGPGMLISVVRGQIVADKFGEDSIDQMRRQNDLAIFEVFKTGQDMMIHKGLKLRYLYPARFRQICQQCHTNSKPGQVAAVVEIVYPIENLKVATNYVNKLMLAYFTISFFVLITFLAFSYRRF